MISTSAQTVPRSRTQALQVGQVGCLENVSDGEGGYVVEDKVTRRKVCDFLERAQLERSTLITASPLVFDLLLMIFEKCGKTRNFTFTSAIFKHYIKKNI